MRSNGAHPKQRKAAPRVRESNGAARKVAAPDSGGGSYDILTAALLGVAIGAGTTFLLRRGPSGHRPIEPAWRLAREGARSGARLAQRGARVAAKRGAEAWDQVPSDRIEEQLHDYYESAKESLDTFVASELEDLRRAIRRRRRKLGL